MAMNRQSLCFRIYLLDIPCEIDLHTSLNALMDRTTTIMDGGYNGKDKRKDWVKTIPDRAVEVVQHPPKTRGVRPEALVHLVIRYVSGRSGAPISREAPVDAVVDWDKLAPSKGFRVPLLPRVVWRTFSWLGQSCRLSKGYERMCTTGEAFIYAAMMQIMVGQLAST